MLPERDAVGVAREMRMEEGGVYVVEVHPPTHPPTHTTMTIDHEEANRT